MMAMTPPCTQPRLCMQSTCARCRWKLYGKRWRRSQWGLLDTSRPELGTWMTAGFGHGGQWGLGCQACDKVEGNVPPAMRPWVEHTVTNPTTLQTSHLKRHAESAFHRHSAAALGQRVVGPTPQARDFQRVFDHVVLHGAAANKGLPDIGGGKKIRKMVQCLAEALLDKDRKFVMSAASISLLRDARHGVVAVRYVAVNDELEVRDGLLGTTSRLNRFGVGGEALLRATSFLFKRFATRRAGIMPIFVRKVWRSLRAKTHMVGVADVRLD